MKSKLTLIAVLLLGVMFSSSCKKDAIENITGSMKANIAGTEWTGMPAGLMYADKMTISATSEGRTIFLYVKGTAVGEYSLSALQGNTDAGSYYKYNPETEGAESVSYFSTVGKVNITSIDAESKRVSGTFEFTASSSSMEVIEITNGTFTNVKYVSGN